MRYFSILMCGLGRAFQDKSEIIITSLKGTGYLAVTTIDDALDKNTV